MIYALILIVLAIFLVFLLMAGQLSDMNSLVDSQEEYESGITTLFSTYGEFFTFADPTRNGKMPADPGVTNGTAAPMITGEDMRSIGDYIFSFFSSLISKLSFFLFTGLLIIPMMFRMYFSKKNVIANEVIEFFPVKYQECVDSSISDIGRRLGDFFSAKILESAIVGTICSIGFYLAGINGWFFLGFIAGLLNIVPYIGPVVGAIPAVIVGFIVSPTTALFEIITVIIAQLVDNLYLIPYMISGKVAVNPLLSILLTLIFADMLGALGISLRFRSTSCIK